MPAFDTYLRTILTEAEREARMDHSSTIEAQHLLLAIADQEGTIPQRLLSAAGLDRQGVHDALDREFEHSLSTVGVLPAAFGFSPPSSDPGRSPHIGSSAKLALERGFTGGVRKRDLQPAHLLLGVLLSEVGTVPRALALAGVDRAELVASVEQAITDEDGRP